MANETGSEAYDMSQRPALVCVDEANRQAAVTSALKELGYRVQVAESAADATERLRKTNYDVLILDEAFQGASPLDHPLLKTVQWLPAATRRYMFVALLGNGFKTFDNIMAFTKSVNAVVSYDDMAQVKAALQRGIAENDEFYRVYRQVLQEAGKR